LLLLFFVDLFLQEKTQHTQQRIDKKDCEKSLIESVDYVQNAFVNSSVLCHINDHLGLLGLDAHCVEDNRNQAHHNDGACKRGGSDTKLLHGSAIRLRLRLSKHEHLLTRFSSELSVVSQAIGHIDKEMIIIGGETSTEVKRVVKDAKTQRCEL
jgi:hypothetical protein